MHTQISQSDFSHGIQVGQSLCRALTTVIRGRDDTVRLVIAALLADGHVLLEDYPGSGKTTLTKTLGRLISHDGNENVPKYIAPFRRIQFTPDLLPGDVIGVNVFDATASSFRFVFGPIFAHIVLADEINRTGPKVQAAFLECMAERQVTVDTATYRLDDLFFVIGTQNPLDIAGTYPLPLVQLDRFLIKIPMGYVDARTEVEILTEHRRISEASVSIDPVCTRRDVLRAREATRSVQVSPALRQAIVDIVQATRGNSLIQFGASTRAALMVQDAVRAWAIINGRDYATEDDLKFMAPYVLLHRLRFHGGAGDAREALETLMAPIIENLVRKALH